MISLRRADKRRHDRRPAQKVWRAFNPGDEQEPPAEGFGSLEVVREGRLPPRAAVESDPNDEAEIITYVREGTLAYEDSVGRPGVIHAGEFQRMTVGHGVRYGETNASATGWAHVFQIWLRPARAGLTAGHEQRLFSAAERHGRLCVIASPDAVRGSLRLHQDTVMYSATLDPGQHLVHALQDGRSAWLHIVEGELSLGDLVLRTGDGAGVSGERAVSFTARTDAEILLLELSRTTESQ